MPSSPMITPPIPPSTLSITFFSVSANIGILISLSRGHRPDGGADRGPIRGRTAVGGGVLVGIAGAARVGRREVGRQRVAGREDVVEAAIADLDGEPVALGFEVAVVERAEDAGVDEEEPAGGGGGAG